MIIRQMIIWINGKHLTKFTYLSTAIRTAAVPLRARCTRTAFESVSEFQVRFQKKNQDEDEKREK